jgi:hypothetical protein
MKAEFAETSAESVEKSIYFEWQTHLPLYEQGLAKPPRFDLYLALLDNICNRPEQYKTLKDNADIVAREADSGRNPAKQTPEYPTNTNACIRQGQLPHPAPVRVHQVETSAQTPPEQPATKQTLTQTECCVSIF